MTEDESTMNHGEKLSAILVASLIVMAFIVTCFPLGVANMFTGTTTTVTHFTDQFIIGYIGCSETWMTVTGYHQLSTKHFFWPQIPTYSGGGIDNYGWANASNYRWSYFVNATIRYGQPQVIWVEDCGSQGPAYRQKANDSYVWPLIQQFFGILRNKAPNAVVYMSAISDIIPNGTCHLSGTFEVAQDTRMTNLAIANGYALAGPFMGPLYNETGYPNMVDNSKCHPNAYGEQVLGAQLVQFFDGLNGNGGGTCGWRIPARV